MRAYTRHRDSREIAFIMCASVQMVVYASLGGPKPCFTVCSGGDKPRHGGMPNSV